MLVDLSIVLFLVLLNGFFAMSELAIVSARRGRLRQMQEEGNTGARHALALADDPSRFLSIVQIGVTLNSILAGAFSGATLAEPLGQVLDEMIWIAPNGQAVALALTVAGVSFLSLVIGELVPKRIGLSYAEKIAVRVAGLMAFLARLFAPVVWVLKLSTEGLLKVLRLHRAAENSVTEDEVRDLIAEGTQSGAIKPDEQKMIEGVMRLADRSVRTIMTPRVDMVWIAREDPVGESLAIVQQSGFSRIPVGTGDMDEVVGILHAKDWLKSLLKGEVEDFTRLMRPPMLVPDTTSVIRLLDQFKQSGQTIAIVIDEYGSVEGLVTTMDVLEAIIGDLPDLEEGTDAPPTQRADGSWLIDGMQPIDEVEALIGLKNMREGGDFHTLAGFVIDKMGRIPVAGDAVVWNAWRFEVVDLDGRRVDKVLASPLLASPLREEEID